MLRFAWTCFKHIPHAIAIGYVTIEPVIHYADNLIVVHDAIRLARHFFLD